MSAICGIYRPNGETVERAELGRIQSELADYGRDGAHRWLDGCLALGHQATWLTPESRYEVLPFFDSQSDLAITADARIDNREELCEALGWGKGDRPILCEAPEGPFRQNGPVPFSQGAGTSSLARRVCMPITDSEIILRAYQKWGTGCPEKLLGDFAFAIWDGRQRRLFCARDIFGVRPFYYHAAADRFLFASDIDAVLAAPGVPHEPDLAYVQAHCRGNYWNDSRTWYASVRKLAHAHAMTIDARGTKVWEYWEPTAVAEVRFKKDEQYAEALRELLTASVQARLRCDYPVGAHVSGGLDCSSVAVVANRALRAEGKELTGFSWSPPLAGDDGQAADERQRVEHIRRQEGMSIHYTQTSGLDDVEASLFCLTRQQSPEYSMELVVRRRANAEGIRLMLSGWGGDELASSKGYGYFAELLARGRWMRMWRELKKRREIKGGPAVWKMAASKGVFPLLPDWVLGRIYPKGLAFNHDDQPISDLYQDAFAARLNAAECLPRRPLRFRNGVRNQLLYLLAGGHLTRRLDRWSAAGGRMGITYAYPLLDRRIVEFVLGLPSHLFHKHGWDRHLYRSATSGILPKEVGWSRAKDEAALMDSHTQRRKQKTPILAELVHAMLSAEREYRCIDATKAIADVTRFSNQLATVGQSDEFWSPENRRQAAAAQFRTFGPFCIETLFNRELARDVREYLKNQAADLGDQVGEEQLRCA